MCYCVSLVEREEAAGRGKKEETRGRGQTGPGLFPDLKTQEVDPNCTDDTAHEFAPKDPTQLGSKAGKNFKVTSAWISRALNLCGYQGDRLNFHMKGIMISHIVDRFRERFFPAWKYWAAQEDYLRAKIKACMQRKRKKAQRAGFITLNWKMDNSSKRKKNKECEAMAGGDDSGTHTSQAALEEATAGNAGDASDTEDATDLEEEVAVDVEVDLQAEGQDGEGDEEEEEEEEDE